MHLGCGNAQLSGGGARRQSRDELQFARADSTRRASEPLALPPSARETSSNPLLDPCTFELRKRTEQVHLQSTRRGRRIDTLVKRDEAHAERLKFLQDG